MKKWDRTLWSEYLDQYIAIGCHPSQNNIFFLSENLYIFYLFYLLQLSHSLPFTVWFWNDLFFLRLAHFTTLLPIVLLKNSTNPLFDNTNQNIDNTNQNQDIDNTNKNQIQLFENYKLRVRHDQDKRNQEYSVFHIFIQHALIETVLSILPTKGILYMKDSPRMFEAPGVYISSR